MQGKFYEMSMVLAMCAVAAPAGLSQDRTRVANDPRAVAGPGLAIGEGVTRTVAAPDTPRTAEALTGETRRQLLAVEPAEPPSRMAATPRAYISSHFLPQARTVRVETRLLNSPALPFEAGVRTAASEASSRFAEPAEVATPRSRVEFPKLQSPEN